MKHEWEPLAPYVSVFSNAVSESFECKHCLQIRLGKPLDVPQDRCWGGPHLVWNQTEECDEKSLEKARESRERCAVGAGIESFGAFFGERKLGFLYTGGIPYK